MRIGLKKYLFIAYTIFNNTLYCSAPAQSSSSISSSTTQCHDVYFDLHFANSNEIWKSAWHTNASELKKAIAAHHHNTDLFKGKKLIIGPFEWEDHLSLADLKDAFDRSGYNVYVIKEKINSASPSTATPFNAMSEEELIKTLSSISLSK